MDKVYLPFYYSWLEITEGMSDEDFGKLVRAILLFSQSGRETEFVNDTLRISYNFIVDIIIRAQKKSETNRQNVNKRWAKRGNSKNENGNTTVMQPYYDRNTMVLPINTNKNINTNINSVSGAGAHTHTPTREEVEEYFKEMGYTFAERFYCYYQSTNWEGVEDWKSRAALWKLDDDRKAKEAEKSRYGSFNADEAFNAALERSYKD